MSRGGFITATLPWGGQIGRCVDGFGSVSIGKPACPTTDRMGNIGRTVMIVTSLVRQS